jgi:hypothetical protein
VLASALSLSLLRVKFQKEEAIRLTREQDYNTRRPTHCLHHSMKKKKRAEKRKQRLRAEAESLGVPLDEEGRKRMENQAAALRAKLQGCSSTDSTPKMHPPAPNKKVSPADVQKFMEQLHLGSGSSADIRRCANNGEAAVTTTTLVTKKSDRQKPEKLDANSMIRSLEVIVVPTITKRAFKMDHCYRRKRPLCE